jgi:hypothetical protein
MLAPDVVEPIIQSSQCIIIVPQPRRRTQLFCAHVVICLANFPSCDTWFNREEKEDQTRFSFTPVYNCTITHYCRLSDATKWTRDAKARYVIIAASCTILILFDVTKFSRPGSSNSFRLFARANVICYVREGLRDP